MGDVIPLRQFQSASSSASGRVPGPLSSSWSVDPYGHLRSGVSPTFGGRLGLTGLRLTRRGRVVLVIMAMLVAAPMVMWGATAVASAPGEALEVRIHAVQPGETLWGFAHQLTEPGEDVRHVVNRLRELNKMSSGDLRVGEVLLLPYE